MMMMMMMKCFAIITAILHPNVSDVLQITSMANRVYCDIGIGFKFG